MVAMDESNSVIFSTVPSTDGGDWGAQKNVAKWYNGMAPNGNLCGQVDKSDQGYSVRFRQTHMPYIFGCIMYPVSQ